MVEPVPDDLFERRRLLYGKGAERTRAAAARTLLAAGRLSEALEMLERGGDPGVVAEVRRAAVAKGDAFALQRAAQLLREEVPPGDWRSLAARAEAAGRHYEAIRALEKAGDAEAAEAMRLKHHPEYVPFKPVGK